MKIGELASATATKVETVRYYEKIGLLSAPTRSGGNYRQYVYASGDVAWVIDADVRYLTEIIRALPTARSPST